MAKQLLVVDFVEEGLGNVRAYIAPKWENPPADGGKPPYLDGGARQAQELMETIYPHLKDEMRAGKEYQFFVVDEVLHEVQLHREPAHRGRLFRSLPLTTAIFSM